MISWDTRRRILAEYCGDRTIQKAFQLEEGFQFGRYPEEVLDAFQNGVELETTVAFVDIAGFSNVIRKYSVSEVLRYLEKFYKMAFPILFKHHGEIEKIIGDGIIAVFGPPFNDAAEGFHNAKSAAAALIKKCSGTNMEIKAALRFGQTYFGFIGSANYFQEATMVGPVLTEVFRLEEVARRNAISVYGGTGESKVMDDWFNKLPSSTTNSASFTVSREEEAFNRKGVDFSKVIHFLFQSTEQ